MKVLIVQAKRSNDIDVMKDMMKKHAVDIVVFPEGYIDNETLLEEACSLAKEYKVPILSSYLADSDRKDNSVIINEYGEKVLCRKKSLVEGPLLEPSKSKVLDMKIGYMLCCEIFLDNIDFGDVDTIFNPIGVGMFSEEQFIEWSGRARNLAEENNCYVIGASHADGSYRNCGISIPIAYVYGIDGEEIYLSHDNIAPVIVDIESKEIKYL